MPFGESLYSCNLGNICLQILSISTILYFNTFMMINYTEIYRLFKRNISTCLKEFFVKTDLTAGMLTIILGAMVISLKKNIPPQFNQKEGHLSKVMSIYILSTYFHLIKDCMRTFPILGFSSEVLEMLKGGKSIYYKSFETNSFPVSKMQRILEPKSQQFQKQHFSG